MNLKERRLAPPLFLDKEEDAAIDDKVSRHNRKSTAIVPYASFPAIPADSDFRPFASPDSNHRRALQKESRKVPTLRK